VASTVYNTFGLPKTVNYGAPLGSITDSYAYDSNTGRMTSFQSILGSGTYSGALSWNGNGTLASLQITDPFNSNDAQMCNYGYNPWFRMNSVQCGAAWSQTMSYGGYGNISKSGSISFMPTYDNTTNRYQTIQRRAHLLEAGRSCRRCH
jgi:hypothetical protein